MHLYLLEINELWQYCWKMRTKCNGMLSDRTVEPIPSNLDAGCNVNITVIITSGFTFAFKYPAIHRHRTRPRRVLVFTSSFIALSNQNHQKKHTHLHLNPHNCRPTVPYPTRGRCLPCLHLQNPRKFHKDRADFQKNTSLHKLSSICRG